jgi:hypothetical protein
MKDKGRSERYIKKTDIGSLLFSGKDKDDNNIKKKLQSCLDCKKKIKEGSKSKWDSSYYERNSMNLLAFFEKYGKPDFENRDKFSESLYSSKYPEN